jgi:phenylalanyl-tRNA synthetase beta chain
LHPGRTAEICVHGERLGVLGQLHPTIAERFDLDSAPVFVAELDFERLLHVAQPLAGAQTPSRFPPADRDIAIVIDEATPHDEVEAAIRDAAGPLLESVRLFDVYRGESIPAGRKSLAFSLRYRTLDRTLADDEVSNVHARVEAALGDRFGAEVRGR